MAFGGFESGPSQPMADINTTPLVDVMLVLLIIFIVCAPLMTQAIKVDLPQASAAPADPKPDTVQVALDAAGKLYWNKTEINAEEMVTRFSGAAAQNPQPEVHLSADKETRYQRVAEVMAAAKEAGIVKLGFVTQPGGTHEPRR
ncbi:MULTISPECIES: ExbD/TolR family protein [Azospira]|jgi:biopolymer transport protein ExbD|uniref:ExbD/TolR family protein n=1 Tax=Azospira TaxID=146937 RepID=UPI0012608739|nr:MULTISPECIES: biopolymer transporter ExbD [Azospira]MDK9690454.1 biopolymer transporter ExbD [Azospira sp.]BBN90317.1 transport-related membrane protein [Azospira sp. I09]